MLSRLTLTLTMLTLGLFLNAQTLSEVLSDPQKPIFYYGIDFTKAKLIGDPNANPQDIIERQFAGINALILNEPKKYDVAGAFRRAELKADLSFTDKRNEKIAADKLISSSTEDYDHLKESDIQALVKGFNGGTKTGTGLLFVVEAMSKPGKAVSLWVTLFDIKSKKVLLAERLEGEVGMGFSFRNYWATGFKKVIDRIQKSKYSEWKSR